jgi:imidazolonepropionase-like amidohydrolase
MINVLTGHYADLIAVDGDPLSDVRALETVAVVTPSADRTRAAAR